MKPKHSNDSDTTRIAVLETNISHINETLIRIEKRFDDVETRIDKRFDDLESRIDKRFDEVNHRIDANETKTDNRFNELERKIDNRFAETNARINKIDNRLWGILILIPVSIITTFVGALAAKAVHLFGL